MRELTSAEIFGVAGMGDTPSTRDKAQACANDVITAGGFGMTGGGLVGAAIGTAVGAVTVVGVPLTAAVGALVVGAIGALVTGGMAAESSPNCNPLAKK